MDAAIAGFVARNGGPVSRQELVAAGVHPDAIDHRLKSGRLEIAFRGVFYLAGTRLDARGWALAGLLAIGRDASASHGTAAHLRGYAAEAPDAVHVTVAGREVRSRRGLIVHCVAIVPPVELHRGVPITTAPRTLLDLAAIGTPAAALGRMVGQALFRKLTTVEELEALCREHAGQRGVRRLASVLHSTGAAPTRSELEQAMLAAIAAAGLPAPFVNRTVDGPEVDLHWRAERVVVEVDGPHHEQRLAREEDAGRDARLAARGWVVVRFTWRQVIAAPHACAARIAEVLAIRAYSAA